MRLLLIFCALMLLCTTANAAPFFDALYNTWSGRGWYGYYNVPQGGGRGGGGGRSGRGHEKSYKEICRVHNPSAVSQPGAGPVICPY